MWGDNWGTMIWGGALAQVPVGPWALLLLGFILGVCALKAKSHIGARLLPVFVAAMLPLIVIGTETLIPFVNGTRADADEVNANFAALAARFSKSNIYKRSELNDACGAGVNCVATAFCDNEDDVAIGGACKNACTPSSCVDGSSVVSFGLGEIFDTHFYECSLRGRVGAAAPRPQADVFCLAVSAGQ